MFWSTWSCFVYNLHACACLRVSLCAYVQFVRVGVCNSFCTAELGDGVLCGGSVRTPLTPGCHCAPVMINHVVQRLALFGREGTNHTPHYPGLVTLKHCSPRTPQPVAVWMERRRRRRRAKCVWRRERELFFLARAGRGWHVNDSGNWKISGKEMKADVFKLFCCWSLLNRRLKSKMWTT